MRIVVTCVLGNTALEAGHSGYLRTTYDFGYLWESTVERNSEVLSIHKDVTLVCELIIKVDPSN